MSIIPLSWCRWLLVGLGAGLLSWRAHAEPLAWYPFTDSSPQPVDVLPGLNAGPVSISANSLSFSSSSAGSWTGPSGVPFVYGTSGWAASTQAEAKHFQFALSVPGGTFSVTNLSLHWRRTASGPSHAGISMNGASLYANELASGVYDSLSLPVSGFAGLTSAVIRIEGWGTTTGGGQFQIDDIIVQGLLAGLSAPVQPASNLAFSAIGGNQVQLSWDNGDGDRRVVILRQGTSIDVLPVDGEEYAASSEFGAGHDLGGGHVVVYHGGADTEVMITGLIPGQTYAATVVEMNGTSTASMYLTDPFPVATVTTLGGGSGLEGAIKVELEPGGAIAAGATWRIDDGDWLPGDFKTNLLAGSYTLSFSPVELWVPPVEQEVLVNPGQTQHLAAVYTPASPTVRIASFNVLVGLDSVGSADYEATKAVLARIDADIVGFQELRNTSSNEWTILAGELGYSNLVWGANNGTLGGGNIMGYYSRFPVADVHDVQSPPGANELTRAPLRASFVLPGYEAPLVLWNVHHKAGVDVSDAFRRSVETLRLVQDIDDYLSVNTGHVFYAVIGDFNGDRNGFQPTSFSSEPAGLPAAYQLGADITFPVAYRTYPDDRYANAGLGLQVVDAVQQDGVSINSHSVVGLLDYLLVSPALIDFAGSNSVAEIYNSAWEGVFEGLPKAGDPLDPGTSALASDHYPLFMDVWLQDQAAFGDPLPGWWRLAYFGTTESSQNFLSRPGDDQDGDGRSNLEEYLADTDPTDADSVFDTFQVVATDSGLFAVVDVTSTGRMYRIHSAEHLTEPVIWQTLAIGQGTGGMWTPSLGDLSATQRYYRATVTLP